MLAALEDAIVERLGALRTSAPRLELRSYGGELSDGDLLADVLRAGHAVLVTVPKADFTRKSGRRFALVATVRLVICSRQPRDERSTRHGTAGSAGTYALWDACVRLLTGWSPMDDVQGMEPTAFANLVNGRDSADYLSVLGQSFRVTGSWMVPEDAIEPITGIDLTYYLQPDDGVADATDRLPKEP